MKSKSGTKVKRQAPNAHRTYKTKTKDDFMRWWREQDAGKKQAVEEQSAQAARERAWALMVWADDGGAVD